MNADDLRLARETALEYHRDATEVPVATPSMYELDAIVDDDGRASVVIMYDEAENVFALVEPELPTPLADAAEDDMRMSELIQQVELKTMVAFGACQTVDDATACWAALSSTVSQSARLRIKELGGDVDEVAAKLDEFFLEHPGC